MTANEVYDKRLCIGCGLCSSLSDSKVDFSFDKHGFYKPACQDDIEVGSYCPGIKVQGEFETSAKSEKIWGPINGIYLGHSTNTEVRYRGSSGGGITGFVFYLLESAFVDGVIQVGSQQSDPLLNSTHVSDKLADLLKNTGSRYAPVLALKEIKQILDESDRTFAFVGKPCDIAGINNFLNLYPRYRKQLKIKISFFCAGTPSINATKQVLKKLEVEEPLSFLKYRGSGWPGHFEAEGREGKSGKMTYNDSWGKILGRDLHMRCKLCPDGIGMLSDITFADGWEESEGYPSFDEKPGESLILSRTQIGKKLLSEAISDRFLEVRPYELTTLKNIQKYQFKRRINVGARILAFTLVKRYFPNYKGLFIYSNLTRTSIYAFMKNFLGGIKRMFDNQES